MVVPRPPHRGSAAELFESRSHALARALRDRDAFFESLSPERRAEALRQQERIEEQLKRAGNQHNRLATIASLMWESLRELNTALVALRSALPTSNDSGRPQ